MELNKSMILVSALCIFFLSFPAEGRMISHFFKHVSSPIRRIKPLDNAPSPSPFPSHISSSPSQSPSPKSEISSFISLAPSTSPENLASSPSQSFALSPDVKHLCDETDDVSSCLSSIGSFLSGSDDPFTILKDGIEAAIDQVNLVITETQKSARAAASLPQVTTRCLKGCLDNFDSAMDNLHESMRAIDDHNMGKLTSLLDAALDDVITCSDSFKEHPEAKSPLGGAHEALYHLIKNCLIMREAIKISPLN